MHSLQDCTLYCNVQIVHCTCTVSNSEGEVCNLLLGTVLKGLFHEMFNILCIPKLYLCPR